LVVGVGVVVLRGERRKKKEEVEKKKKRIRKEAAVSKKKKALSPRCNRCVVDISDLLSSRAPFLYPFFPLSLYLNAI